MDVSLCLAARCEPVFNISGFGCNFLLDFKRQISQYLPNTEASSFQSRLIIADVGEYKSVHEPQKVAEKVFGQINWPDDDRFLPW